MPASGAEVLNWNLRFLADALTVFYLFICCFFHNENFFLKIYVCVYVYIYIYIYIWDSRCAVVRYDTVLRRTRQCSNRSRLLKFWASKVIPHLAITGELWGVFVRYMYKNDCDTSWVHYISLSKSTGMKLSYKRLWYIYIFSSFG